MAKFEVTMGIDGHNENEVLSNVYKALYTGDLDADYVKVRRAKRRGELVPEVDPKVATRLLGGATGGTVVRPQVDGRYLN